MIEAERRHWTDAMTSPTFTRAERAHVTLLVGGLTAAQDFLVQAALLGLGYRVRHLEVPTNAALQLGKEFGNRGQCNPTYFTVGNLVKELLRLRDVEGIDSAKIVKDHVFLTAGACGPCRFGMYATEYRKALRDAGFDGFRVLLFQQQGGLRQATGADEGLALTPAFFVAVLKAIVAGDVLNALVYRIRPYELDGGSTDRAMNQAKAIVARALGERRSVLLALRSCRELFAAIEVDRLRPRAKASIIGEFWAMTTEGDGNYHLQRLLEGEGAENDIQLTSGWILYLLWQARRDAAVRADLRGVDAGREVGGGAFAAAARHARLRIAESGVRVGFAIFARAAGLRRYALPDMDALADAAASYYSHDLRGGEGHMEVGKVILNVRRRKAHVTVSVKPFGCMPSSGVSDGVQSLVVARHPGTIFCAVETSGDGATNFQSRIQMYLYKARQIATQELAEAYRESGVSEAEARAFVARRRELGGALHHPPHRVAGTAANLVYEIAPLLRLGRFERVAAATRRGAGAAGSWLATVPAGVGARSRNAAGRLWNDLSAIASLVLEKVRG